MPNAIKRCELEMTLALLRAMDGGCVLAFDDEWYVCDPDELEIGVLGPCVDGMVHSIKNISEDFDDLERLESRIERGPWLPGVIEKVERELEGLK